MVTMCFWCVVWNFVLCFVTTYLAFKIDFDRRDARVVNLQHAMPGYMYRISLAMKIKHKMCGREGQHQDLAGKQAKITRWQAFVFFKACIVRWLARSAPSKAVIRPLRFVPMDLLNCC